MYVFGGVSQSHEPARQEVWCLDLCTNLVFGPSYPFLATFTWSQVNFKGWEAIPGGN